MTSLGGTTKEESKMMLKQLKVVHLEDVQYGSYTFDDDINFKVDLLKVSKVLGRCIEQLSTKKQEVITEYFFNDKTIEEIANEKHKSKSTISYHKNGALAQLRSLIAYNPLDSYITTVIK